MKKNRIIILVFIFSILAGCCLFLLKGKKLFFDTETSKTAVKKEISPSLGSESFCGKKIEEIIANKENIGKKDLRGTMYLVINSLVKGENYCENIADTDSKNLCQDNLLAYQSLRKERCSEIKNPDFSAFCSAMAKKDPSLCSIENNSDKIICEAVALRNLDKCEDMDNIETEFQKDTEKETCRNNVRLTQAVEANDQGKCDQINKETSLQSSFGFFACQAITSPEKEKILDDLNELNCNQVSIISKINESGDRSICEQIPFKQIDNRKIYASCIELFKK